MILVKEKSIFFAKYYFGLHKKNPFWKVQGLGCMRVAFESALFNHLHLFLKKTQYGGENVHCLDTMLDAQTYNVLSVIECSVESFKNKYIDESEITIEDRVF